MDVGASREAGTSGRHRHAEDSPGTRQGSPFLVVLGRATLALVPLLWVTAYLTRPIWMNAPIVDGHPDHPLVTTFFVLSLTIGAFTPFLVLPVGLAAHTTIDPPGVLTVTTVLGRRRLELNRLSRIGALTMSSQNGLVQYFLYLRAGRFRWVLVLLGQSPHLAGPLRDFTASAVDERPDLLSARARTMLRMGTRPGLRQRIALGTVTFVVGIAASAAWMFLAWSLILAGWMPRT